MQNGYTNEQLKSIVRAGQDRYLSMSADALGFGGVGSESESNNVHHLDIEDRTPRTPPTNRAVTPEMLSAVRDAIKLGMPRELAFQHVFGLSEEEIGCFRKKRTISISRAAARARIVIKELLILMVLAPTVILVYVSLANQLMELMSRLH